MAKTMMGERRPLVVWATGVSFDSSNKSIRVVSSIISSFGSIFGNDAASTNPLVPSMVTLDNASPCSKCKLVKTTKCFIQCRSCNSCYHLNVVLNCLGVRRWCFRPTSHTLLAVRSYRTPPSHSCPTNGHFHVLVEMSRQLQHTPKST